MYKLARFIVDKRTETRRGLSLMEEEFTTLGSARVMAANITYEQAARLAEALEEVEGVAGVVFDGTEDHYQNASALFDVSFEEENDTEGTSAALAEVFSELGLPLNGDPEKIFASSDIGNISYVCPSFHPCLQVADCGTALHTRQFAAVMKTARAHQALDDGAKLIALHTAKIFGDEELFQAMKADFGQ